MMTFQALRVPLARTPAPVLTHGADGARAQFRAVPAALSKRAVSLRFPQRHRAMRLTTRAMSDDSKALAPLKPVSPAGEFLNYILNAEPQLFMSAVDDQLERLANEKKEIEEATASEDSEMVLYQRINDVKAVQLRHALEDLMYSAILHKFVNLGVDLLPEMESVSQAGPSNYKALTEGVHSNEALELVKQHLSTILGEAPPAYSNVMLRISKLQAAQVYAASVMFGYFLRKADKYFHLDKSMGMLPKSAEDTMKTLEAMFNSAEGDGPEVLNPDFPTIGEEGKAKQHISLKEYIEQFDLETLTQTARIVSLEGVTLVERHTGALFGSVQELQEEMQKVVGNVETPQELYERMKEAVTTGEVATLTLTYPTQRRIILEAVAFGSFLRDVESMVVTEHQLLTPATYPQMPPPRELNP